MMVFVMRLTKKVTVYVPDELDEWIKNDMPRNVNLSEEVRNFLYTLKSKYTIEKQKVTA
jgi:hypothetical protein